MLNRRRTWLVGAIMSIALLAASCGNPAAETTTTTKTTNPSTDKPTATTSQSTDVPQYGGTLTLLSAADVMGFDEAFQPPWFCWTTHLTEDEMLNGDWSKGPAGTGQYTWILEGIYNWDSKIGSLCESWEVVAPNHYIFKVRHGVHFGVNQNSEATRLTSGREMTAEDVVYSYDRMRTLTSSYVYNSHPDLSKKMKMTAVDKWTIDLEVPNDTVMIYNIAQVIVDWSGVVAKEVIDKYGDMKDWKVAHGTGPFFLTDYVSGSSVSFEKNTRYWDKDPVGPGKGQQLPYVDGLKFLIVTDTSTQLAALRTARVDQQMNVYTDEAFSIKKLNPEIDFVDFVPAGAYHIYMRTDKQDLPYKDIKVRQALMKAIDFKALVDDYMKGNAVYPTYPILPMDDLKAEYLPLTEASAAAQDLYNYDLTKAKALLKEAGYPGGFDCTILTSNNPSSNVDYLSIIKQMWSDIDVNLTITVLEQGVYNNRWNARNYEDMFYGTSGSSGTFRYMNNSTGSGGGYNLSYINDSRLIEGRLKLLGLFTAGKDDEVAKLHRELSNIIYENAWAINSPAERRTTFWWPWVKNYHGEQAVGILNSWGWTKWTWIDQGLKASMGH